MSSEQAHTRGSFKTVNAALRDKLRQANLRPTRQRVALARLLFTERDQHVTAESLHRQAGAAHVDVSVPTVYNTLHHFTRVGLLREVVVDARRRYFDTNVNPHQHLFYEGEDRLEDIDHGRLSVSGLPELADGDRIQCVDIIIRVARD